MMENDKTIEKKLKKKRRILLFLDTMFLPCAGYLLYRGIGLEMSIIWKISWIGALVLLVISATLAVIYEIFVKIRRQLKKQCYECGSNLKQIAPPISENMLAPAVFVCTKCSRLHSIGREALTKRGIDRKWRRAYLVERKVVTSKNPKRRTK